MERVQLIGVVALGIYELLSRVIPTSKTWSIIGNVLGILQRISTSIDTTKRQTKK